MPGDVNLLVQVQGFLKRPMVPRKSQFKVFTKPLPLALAFVLDKGRITPIIAKPITP